MRVLITLISLSGWFIVLDRDWRIALGLFLVLLANNLGEAE